MRDRQGKIIQIYSYHIHKHALIHTYMHHIRGIHTYIYVRHLETAVQCLFCSQEEEIFGIAGNLEEFEKGGRI